MCTPAEVKTQVYEAFEEEGGMKEQMREQTMADMNRLIVKVLSAVGIVLLSAIISFTIYLNNMDNRLSQLSTFAESGERFTQQDGALLKLQIQANQAAVANSASTQEVKELKEAFIRLDERLRNKGI